MPREKSWIWSHYRVSQDGKVKTCKYCCKAFKANTTYLASHYYTCSSRVPPEAEASSSASNEASTQASTSSGASGGLSRAHLRPKSRLRQQPLRSLLPGLSAKERKEANKHLVKCIVTSSLPFSFVSSEYFRSFVSCLRPGFQLPSHNTIKGPLLNSAYADHMEETRKALASASFVAICFDGWTNVRQDKVVNVVACVRRPLLLASVQVKGTLDAKAYAKIVCDTISSFDLEDKVVQLVTDGESTVAAAKQEIRKQFRFADSSSCKSHGLNLLIGDLIKCPSVSRVARLLIKILNKLKYSRTARRTADTYAQRLNGADLPRARLPPATRWQYWSQALECAYSMKSVLSFMSRKQGFTSFFRRGTGDSLDEEERQVLEEMKDEDVFWSRIRSVSRQTCLPPFSLLPSICMECCRLDLTF